MIFLEKEKLSEHDEFLLRCCVTLFQIYLVYLGNPEEKIKLEWNNKLKPFILKMYPFEKDGVFNKNTDVQFLIKEIDKIISQGNNKQTNKGEKPELFNNIRMNTIFISSTKFLEKDNNKNKKLK